MIFLVDFKWCCYKYHYAYSRIFSNVDGQEVYTGLQFGFTRLIQKLHSFDYQPTVVFCLDSVPKERFEVLSEYKSDRPSEDFGDSVDEAMGLLLLTPNVMFVETEGKEADDLIANFAFNLKEKGHNPFVFSNDDDFLQLVSHGISVFKGFIKNQFDFKDELHIQKKYGVPADELLLFRVMTGDSSDRIPGVVPRMRKDFLRAFVHEWKTNSLKYALFDWARRKPGYQQKLIANKDKIIRNLRLMSLVKYRHAKHRFKSKSVGKPQPDLLFKYNFNSYQGFLVRNKFWTPTK